MTDTADHVEDRLADFTRDRRILLLSLMAIVIGVLSAITAKALVWLIAVITNLTFYQRFSSDFISPTEMFFAIRLMNRRAPSATPITIPSVNSRKTTMKKVASSTTASP